LTDLNQNTPPKVRVFYDGSCPLCLVEIGHYKRADSNGALRLIDVSSDDFIGDAQITQQAAMARFHVRLADDRQLSGAHGFVEVWKVIPSWIWLAKLANIPGVLCWSCFTRFSFSPARSWFGFSKASAAQWANTKKHGIKI
jgi:predicted DCC family thiol-disulfide oxidoreductase YuxK